MNYATIVLKGNVIFDGTDNQPFKGGVAIQGNRILDVTNENDIQQYIGCDTQVFEFEDQLIMPGFNDSHTHITSGSFYEDTDFCCCLLSCTSMEEALKTTKEFADSHPDNEWVFGYMMNNLIWEDQTLPTFKEIDAVIPNRPVMLQLPDLHTLIVNTKAMEKVGITKNTLNPADGIIEKDEKGECTGRFYDGACTPFNNSLFDASDELYLEVYTKFFDKMKSLGVTTVGLVEPFGVNKDPLKLFEKMDEENKLTTRIMAYPYITTYQKDSYHALVEKYSGNKIKVRGLKQLVDGVTSVFTAYLLEPYTNDPTTCGSTSVDLSELRLQILEAYKDNVACRIHTIGDRAVRELLDIFEEAQKKYGKKDIRNVLEHCETVHPDDIKRFKELNVSCGMQPGHMRFDLEGGDKGNGLYGDKEAAVGKERAQHCWPLRELWDNGAIISFGSDYPVVGVEPMEEIYSAITRQTFDALPEGGWIPAQRITMHEALQAYTKNSAYVEGIDKELGTLEKGKLADIVVLDRNLFDVEPQEILQTKVVLTIMDGEIVYKG